MWSFLTRSHLRPRLPTATTVEVLLRLPTATAVEVLLRLPAAAAIEVLLRRLRRRPRRRGHVVHFTLLLRSAVHGATAGIGLRRPFIASNSHVGLLGVTTTRATANLRAAGSRRPVVPASHMDCRLTARARAMIRAHVARWSVVVATTARPRVGIGASASTRRAIVPASHMDCRLTARVRAMIRAHVARRSVVVATTARPNVGIGTSASTRPVVVAGEMGVSAVLGPVATATRTAAYLSASRSSRWPIIMAGYIRRTTMPRPATVG
jgi:hypothetical protein